MSKLYNKKTNISVQETARKITERKGRMKAAAANKKKKAAPKKSKARKISKTTSADYARRTKHKGSKGEVAYGQKMGESPIKRKKK